MTSLQETITFEVVPNDNVVISESEVIKILASFYRAWNSPNHDHDEDVDLTRLEFPRIFVSSKSKYYAFIRSSYTSAANFKEKWNMVAAALQIDHHTYQDEGATTAKLISSIIRGFHAMKITLENLLQKHPPNPHQSDKSPSRERDI